MGKWHRHLKQGTRRQTASNPPRVTLRLPRITVISGMLSQLCLYMITQHPDLCPALPICKKFALQRGTVSASCTKLSNFSNYCNLPLFQRKEKTVVQRKRQQKGKAGKKTLLKCDLQHMFSGRICPEEAKVVLKPYYFKKLQACAEHACK